MQDVLKKIGMFRSMIIIAVVLLAYWIFVFQSLLLPEKNHLNVKNTSLGSLVPGSKVEFVVNIDNTGSSVVSLETIKTSCGCLVANNNRTTTIHPGINRLAFIYSVPNSPGEIVQDIYFFAKKGVPSFWSAKISGTVESNVWSIPGRVRFFFDETEKNSNETFTLFFHEHKKIIKEIRCIPQSLKCERTYDGIEQQTFMISCEHTISDDVLKNGKKSGIVTFVFDDEGDKNTFDLNVDFFPKPKFQVYPERIKITYSNNLKTRVTQKIAIKVLDETILEKIRVTPIEDWVKLKDSYINGNYCFYTFEFSPAEMPINTYVPFVRLFLDGLPEHYQVECKSILDKR